MYKNLTDLLIAVTMISIQTRSNFLSWPRLTFFIFSNAAEVIDKTQSNKALSQ